MSGYVNLTIFNPSDLTFARLIFTSHIPLPLAEFELRHRVFESTLPDKVH